MRGVDSGTIHKVRSSASILYGSIMDDLLKYLLPSNVNEKTLNDKIIPHLFNKGFKTVGDLEDLEEADLDGTDVYLNTYLVQHKFFNILGFDDLTKRRIWRLVHSVNRPSAFSIDSDLCQEEESTNIYLRYVFCASNLFSNDIMQTVMKDIDPTTVTLLDITNRILKDDKICPDHTIEMYSSEGYPLHNNEITNKGIPAFIYFKYNNVLYIQLSL